MTQQVLDKYNEDWWIIGRVQTFDEVDAARFCTNGLAVYQRPFVTTFLTPEDRFVKDIRRARLFTVWRAAKNLALVLRGKAIEGHNVQYGIRWVDGKKAAKINLWQLRYYGCRRFKLKMSVPSLILADAYDEVGMEGEAKLLRGGL